MIRIFSVALALVASIVVLPAAAGAQTAAKAVTAAGTVKSVTTQALTLVSGGKDMVFTIDGTTKFIGKGLSTKSAKGKIMATDAIGVDDRVRVTYHQNGSVLHAASVRITEKRKT